MTSSLLSIQPSSPNAAVAQTANAMPETTPEQRAEVQRKLGRCLLRLQQYELLTKAILVDHEQSGTVADWEARRQARIDKFAKKTLGQLVEWMKSSYLTVDLEGRQSREPEPPAELTRIWFSFHGGMQMDSETYQRTVAAMQELVELRNDIVHHLLENFNLWTLQGCAAADAHLEQSYELIDRHMVQIGEWARHMDQARQIAASFMASDEYLDLIVDKQRPVVPPLDWHSPIVECLREAEALLAVDGWALLDDAIALIGRTDRDENPARYGCKSWRQVLRNSGAFEFERQALPERSGLYTAYRSVPRPPTNITIG